jgi:hypothetical protein
MDKDRSKEGAGLVSPGCEKGLKGAAKGDEEGLGGELPLVSQGGLVRRFSGGVGLPGSSEGRPEAQIMQGDAVQLPVESGTGRRFRPIQGGGGRHGGQTQ